MAVDEYEECSNEEIAEAICQVHAVMTAAQARLFELIRVFDERRAYEVDGCRNVASWLVQGLSVSAETARGYATTAKALGCLPQLDKLFSAGAISFDQLRPVAKIADPDSDEELARVLPSMSAASAEALARRAREVPPKDEAEAHRRRHLRIWWKDQVLKLSGSLAGLDAEAFRVAIDRLAESYGPDPTTGQYEPFETRRADALVELARQAIAEDTDPDRADVVIFTNEDVLAGKDGPAETVDGQGVTAESARREACDSRVSRIERDSRTGAFDLGRTTRSIPPHMSRWLRRRDGGCRFPGCGSKRLVQGHHIVHWAAGGPTDRGNICSLCRLHHRLMHEGGWQIEGNPEEEITFVSPNGRRLRSRPTPLRDDVRRRLFGDDPSGGDGRPPRE